MLRFLQINLNGNWSAEQLMVQTADEVGADVLIISEPATPYGQEDRWCFSRERKAAVGLSRHSVLIPNGHGSGEGFAWLSFQELTVFSCYWRPGSPLQEYAAFLGNLEVAIRARGNNQVVLAGDFNAWNIEWGSRVDNHRGGPLSDLATSLGLILANTGDSPTFIRGAATSIIDVTFYRGINLTGWQVLDAESLSDHQYILFSTADHDQVPVPIGPTSDAPQGWSTRKLDVEALGQFFDSTHLIPVVGPISAGKALASAATLDAYLTAACEASMPRKRSGPPGKPPVFWWSEDIAELRRQSLSLRRNYQRRLNLAGQPGVQEARFAFTGARRKLRIAIRDAKKKCWSELCSQVDTDPWGRPYKLVMRKLGRRVSGDGSRGREAGIADFLFPAAPVTDWVTAPSAAVHNLFELSDPATDAPEFTRVIPDFTMEELTKASKRLSAGKAAGPSGIPNEVLRFLLSTRPRGILRLYNNCLRALTFPPCWKKARLVLLRKGPDKPVEVPSSFRPICMLDTPGKLLERLLLQRLEDHLDARERRRAPNQYGFRKGVGTESAIAKVLEVAAQAASGSGQKDLCVLVTLDVQNAFNTLRWPVIDEALRKKNTPEYLVEMIRSWLSDRALLTGAEMASRPVTCGVPQGSVLGPTLWNVSYDSLLEMQVPPGVHLVGFADDLAVIGVARTGQLLEDKINPVLRTIDTWMTQRGLQLAHQKSEAVLLTKRRAYVPPSLVVGGHQIKIAKNLRYLGVILDQRLTFAPHIDAVAKKASRSAAALSRLMPNLKGPCQWKRRLLSSVVESQLLYAAPVWATKVAETARTKANLIRPQRVVALRVIRAYRTVSDEAALILACMPPADLMGLERLKIRDRLHAPIEPGEPRPSKAAIKRQERRSTIDRWQERWDATEKGEWTRQAIPNVRRWLERTVPKVPLTYHMTQALTNHGCFQQYLHRMARATTPSCWHCPDDNDTAEHTLFICPYWSGLRDELGVRLGHRPSAADLPGILCGPDFDHLPEDPGERAMLLSNAEEAFRLFYGMVEKILSLKETEERARQAAE